MIAGYKTLLQLKAGPILYNWVWHTFSAKDKGKQAGTEEGESASEFILTCVPPLGTAQLAGGSTENSSISSD